MAKIEPLAQLVDYAGVGQGCLVCSDQHVTTTDTEAAAHMAAHSPDELAWALLLWAGQTQALTEWCAEQGGIPDETKSLNARSEITSAAFVIAGHTALRCSSRDP